MVWDEAETYEMVDDGMDSVKDIGIDGMRDGVV